MTTEERARSITRILERLPAAPRESARELLPVVYEELRALARGQMAREGAGHTLQPTALVHEAFLRLVKDEGARFENRRHFIGAAAEAMRRILIEHARRARRGKRGGGRVRVTLDGLELAEEPKTHSLLDLDQALSTLEARFPDKAEVVKMRFFGGLSVAETAEVLGLAEITIHKHWRFARAWLLRAMRGGTVAPPGLA